MCKMDCMYSIVNQILFEIDCGYDCAAIITDDNVARIYKCLIEKVIKGSEKPVHVIVIPHGESSKSRSTKTFIENRLFCLGFSSTGILIAMGGGVVTDIVGFVAHTFKRSVPFISIPTTLVGMVDASIGGKNGINTRYGKNSLGTVFFPKKIIVNKWFLETLSHCEIECGFAEIVKCALVADKKMFNSIYPNNLKNRFFLRRHPRILAPLHRPCYSNRGLLRGRSSIWPKSAAPSSKIPDSSSCLGIASSDYDMEWCINRCIEIKQKIVEIDPFDNGIRRSLNFGHTFGHALEMWSDYSIKHGEAVWAGLLVESYVSFLKNLLKEDSLNRIVTAILSRRSLSTHLRNLCGKSLYEFMSYDKKSNSKFVRMVLISDIGKVFEADGLYCAPVDLCEIERGLDWLRNEVCYGKTI